LGELEKTDLVCGDSGVWLKMVFNKDCQARGAGKKNQKLAKGERFGRGGGGVNLGCVKYIRGGGRETTRD